MHLKIHRGAREIGGTCIELVSNGFHLVLDLGMPLVNPDGSPYELPRASSRESLQTQGLLPEIPALFEAGKEDAAIILSHGHADHFGFSGYCAPGIPVYGTVGTRVLMEMTRLFQPAPPLPPILPLDKHVPQRIGPFTVTAWPVPHSAPDAVALLIEAEGKRLFYSGDLRSGGRTGRLFEMLLDCPPEDLDLMLLEGTTVGRAGPPSPTEDEVEERLVEIVRGAGNLTMLFCSSQNLDRLVTAFRVAKRAGVTLVIDLNHAFVLHSLQFLSPRIPQVDWGGIRVKFWKPHADAIAQAGRLDFLYQANRRKIRMPEIAAAPGRFLMLAKSNRFLRTVLRHLPSPATVPVIWSMWRGYWERDRNLRPLCQELGTEPVFLHAGGHASPGDLQRLVNALRPKMVLPVHTFHPEGFPVLFPQTRILPDRECLEV
ncbi:MAG: MBL fold metallo-hydrolase [Candidatus Riflebacteria bacterium]|nr:MBL fold metallo-hydrolase [Candidatus Riflebacteria bacterium]